MLIKFEIETSNKQDVEDALTVIHSLRAEKKPIDKKIEEVAKEKNLNPAILAQGLQAALTQQSTVSDVNEVPVPPIKTVTENGKPLKAEFKENSIDIEFEETLSNPVPQPQVEPQGVELDSEGLPWDHRIHSSSKKKLAKTGAWKLARGVDHGLVEKVKAELKGVMNIPVETPAAPATPVPQPQPEPQTIVTPPPAPTPKPEPVTDNVTFPEFMMAVTEAGLDESEVTKACNAHGIDSVYLLAARPDLVTPVYNELFL